MAVSILVTGLESSGTRAMRNLVAQISGQDAMHMSWPDREWEWGPEDIDYDKVIIVVRRPDIRNLSALARGHIDSLDKADEQWYHGIYKLAGIPDALWVSYEAMVGNQEVQIDRICQYLGVQHIEPHMDWIDENDKYDARVA